MGIVTNTLNATNTPFFKSHVPYNIPQGTSTSYQLSDLIFINYAIPNVPVKINQMFGAESSFRFTVSMRNLTSNILLEVEIITGNFFKVFENNRFQLPPNSQKSMEVEVDNSYINTLASIPISQTDFKIKVKNLTQELPILVPISLPTKTYFSQEITVD